MGDCPCKSDKTKARTEEQRKKLDNRLARIEGQVRGLRRMIEEDAYCVDVITQGQAISKALNSFNKELMACHIRSCVVEGIRQGDEEIIEELVDLTQKLMK